MEATTQEEYDRATQCSQCGQMFVPKWLDGLNKFSTVCATCGSENLLRFLSDIENARDCATETGEESAR